RASGCRWLPWGRCDEFECDGGRPAATQRPPGARGRMRRLAALLALLLAANSALAQQPPKPAPKPAPTPAKPAPKSPFAPPAFKITIATEAAYPPFNYLDKKGLPAGFEMELAQEACQRMKAECEFIAVKWD